ncbi:hypothetical protein ACFLSA_02015 [Bacteroidota bacterium]
MKLRFLIIILIYLVTNNITAQEYSIGGYISEMPSIIYNTADKRSINDNLLHNRLNFFWYPSNQLTFSLQFRNRFISGDQFGETPDYADAINRDAGIMDLSWNLIEGNKYVLNTSIDRLWLQYSLNNLDVKIGRQRINWGQTFVWNPNDIFNVYSFFDFDYIERPGSDAIRISYYPNFTSVFEVAGKFEGDSSVTLAALYRFNKVGYDIQFLGGLMEGRELVVGTGWTGNMKSVSFTGELTYLHQIENYADTNGYLFSGIGLSYMFENSLNVQVDGLYSQFAAKHEDLNIYDFFTGELNVKKLSISPFTYFAQVSYPFNPLVNASFSGMYFPSKKGFYIGPTFGISLKDNLELSVISQNFSMKDENLGTDERIWIYLGFLRFKLAF